MIEKSFVCFFTIEHNQIKHQPFDVFRRKLKNTLKTNQKKSQFVSNQVNCV